MATFKAGEHEWRVRLTVGMLGHLRADAKFDIGKHIKDADLSDALFGDPVKLANILWVFCREEAESRGMAQEGFFGLLGGDELEAACAAVVEAICDFFQRGRAAEIKATLPDLMRKVNETAARAVKAEVEAILSKPGGGLPASSAVTPEG